MKTPLKEPLQINLQILHLGAVLTDNDPLQLAAYGIYASKDQMKQILARIQRLKGIMPEQLLTQVVGLLEALNINRGGPIRFNQTFNPDDAKVLNKWLKIIREIPSLMDSELP